jgi:hypothetical protein
MDSLGRFQNAFAQALMAPHSCNGSESGTIGTLAAQPGFAVYRNTVMKGCIDTLQANYPAVVRLTGEEWFRAAAAIYVRETPPHDPTLLHYGASFAAFLARFEPAAELPYLPGVAQLDRLWTESHIARDEATLDAAAITTLAPEKLATAVLVPHAAARWAWFADAPIFSIWSHNRAGDVANNDSWEPEWKAEGALLTRAHDAVEWVALDAADCAFLDACATGGTLAQAANAALAAEDGADLQQLMRTLLRAGAFNRMSNTRSRNS